jgi:hypothetical protein
LIRATKASGTQWGRPLGVVAQPPLLKNSWRRWSASPLLLRGAQSPLLLLRKRWWPQKRRESAAPAVVTAEEAAAVEAQEEAPTEAGLVDIASILGAPTVTVVRSSL